MQDHQSDSDSSDNSMERLPSFTRNLRIVLLGVSEAGKSSVGNAILGRKAFEESRTRESEKQRGRVENINTSIIDTPGFFNDHLTEKDLQKQMMKSLDLSDPGPHMFLLIVNLKNFEKDERNIVEEIEKIFGAQALKFTMVLFIGRERMSDKEWNDFTLGEKFKGLVNNFREQYHEINSTNEIDQTQKKELIIKIDELFKHNEYYNNKIYSVSQTSSTKEKQDKERQKEVSQETLEINTAMEEGATHENVSQTKKTTDEETNLQGINTLDGALPFPSQGKQKQDKSEETSHKSQQKTEEEHPTQAGVSAAPSAPPLPAEQQLDLDPGVATRIKDKLKKMHRGCRCWVLATVCLVLICVLQLVVIKHQHNTIKEQKDCSNMFKFVCFIRKAVQLWNDLDT